MSHNLKSKTQQTDQTPYFVFFSHTPGIGATNFYSLLQHYKSPSNLFNANPTALQQFIRPKALKAFLTYKSTHTPHKILSDVYKKDIQVVTPTDPNFPESLLNIPTPPICLYIKGNTSLLQKRSIAIVGTRKPSQYGIDMTNTISSILALNKISIISGMAFGVDVLAHKQALAHDSGTIAVLASSVDIPSPHSNKHIYTAILQNEGLIISEVPPSNEAKPGMFIQRNRLISAISDSVIVVEGSHNSGALITARYAANQGRDVYVLPNRIDSNLAEAPHILLKHGAIPITHIRDVNEYFCGEIQHETSAISIILENIKENPLTVEQLESQTSLTKETLLRRITELELSGTIVRNINNTFSLIHPV